MSNSLLLLPKTDLGNAVGMELAWILPRWIDRQFIRFRKQTGLHDEHVVGGGRSRDDEGIVAAGIRAAIIVAHVDGMSEFVGE